jgi:hypothetical protein
VIRQRQQKAYRAARSGGLLVLGGSIMQLGFQWSSKHSTRSLPTDEQGDPKTGETRGLRPGARLEREETPSSVR